MKKTAQTVWINRGPYPVSIAFCPSEKAWNKTMKKMNIQSPNPYPKNDACVSYFQAHGGHVSAIITVSSRFGKKTCPVSLTGLIIHEVTHVWQKVLENMGETKASSEMEAYGMQFISLQVMDAFCETRHVLYKGWKPN